MQPVSALGLRFRTVCRTCQWAKPFRCYRVTTMKNVQKTRFFGFLTPKRCMDNFVNSASFSPWFTLSNGVSHMPMDQAVQELTCHNGEKRSKNPLFWLFDP